MKFRFTHPYSLLAIIILFLLMIQARLWAPYWNTHNVQAILTWDAMGYYIYLPAHFIYHDLSHMAFASDIMREYNPSSSFYQAFQVPGGPEGQLVTKYTCGLAILWTPFFYLGHWAANWFDFPQDGFSAPYQLAIAFGGMLYALLGLGLLRRVLLRYFSDVIVTIVLALIVLGSNYLQYAVFDAAMSHNYLFTGYALLLLLTIRWHERPTGLGAFAIGITLGFLVLIRPSEAVAIVIPLLWGVGTVAAAQRKVFLLRTRLTDVGLLVIGGMIGVLPQLIYWRWATGHFLFYSYGDQHFSFLRPHLWEVLFSFRKGWLLYSPLLLMPIIGIGIFWRRNRELAIPVLAFFLLNMWVVSAWDIWWYGGSIGQRALVQSYAVLALPWAALVAWLMAPHRRKVLLLTAIALIVLLVNLNLFQHWQYMRSIIHPEEMNRRYYFAVFNNSMPTQADVSLLDVSTHLPKAERHYEPQILSKANFESQAPDAVTGISNDMGYYSRQSFRADPTHMYSPSVDLRLTDMGVHSGQYLRISCRVFSDYGAWGNKLVMSIEREGKSIAWEGARLQNILSTNRAWNLIYFDVATPADVRPNDLLKVYVLNENGAVCYIDDVQVELMKLKKTIK